MIKLRRKKLKNIKLEKGNHRLKMWFLGLKLARKFYDNEILKYRENINKELIEK